MTLPRTAAWRRLDPPGAAFARLARDGDEIRATGREVTASYAAGFAVVLDDEWRPQRAVIEAVDASGLHTRRIVLDADGGWNVDGALVDELAGCDCLDIAATPLTNTFPIRRLGLAPGEEAEITAVWVDVPSLDVRPATQRYRREDDGDQHARYRYSSDAGSWLLEVDDDGLVVTYEGVAEPLAWTGDAQQGDARRSDTAPDDPAGG